MRSTALLAVGVLLVTALGVVWARHENRQAFQRLEAEHAERDRLNVEWGQLMIEQGVWSLHHVIDRKARETLGMRVPRPDEIELVHLSGNP